MHNFVFCERRSGSVRVEESQGKSRVVVVWENQGMGPNRWVRKVDDLPEWKWGNGRTWRKKMKCLLEEYGLCREYEELKVGIANRRMGKCGEGACERSGS